MAAPPGYSNKSRLFYRCCILGLVLLALPRAWCSEGVPPDQAAQHPIDEPRPKHAGVTITGSSSAHNGEHASETLTVTERSLKAWSLPRVRAGQRAHVTRAQQHALHAHHEQQQQQQQDHVRQPHHEPLLQQQEQGHQQQEQQQTAGAADSQQAQGLPPASVGAAAAADPQQHHYALPGVDDPPYDAPEFDIVTLALKPSCVSTRTVRALQRYLAPRTIHVLTISGVNCSQFTAAADPALPGTVRCWEEDHLVPGLTKAALGALLEAKAGGDAERALALRYRRNWYWQQVLKLGVARSPQLALPRHYVVWDVDMVPLRPIRLFEHDPGAPGGWRLVLSTGGLVYPGYVAAYARLFGGRAIEHAPDGTSFVTHHMVVDRDLMRELLDTLSITSTTSMENGGDGASDHGSSSSREEARGGNNGSGGGSGGGDGGNSADMRWVQAIVEAVDDSSGTGFSEYWTWCSWLLQEHAGSVRLHPAGRLFVRPDIYEVPPLDYGGVQWYTGEAAAAALLGDHRELTVCCPTPEVLKQFALTGASFLGIEVGHFDACNYEHPAFEKAYLPDFWPREVEW